MTLPSYLRALLLSLLVVLMAACAADEAADEPDPDDGEESAETDDEDDTDSETDDDTDSDTASDTGSDDDAAAEGPEANQTACVDEPEDGVDYFPERVAFEHADSVDVTYHDTHKVLEIAVPFDDAPVRYVLLQCGLDAPELEGDLEDAKVIEVPVGEAATTTTTNLPHFDALGAVDTLVGVGNPDFVTTDSVLEAIEAGDVEGMADAEGSPDLERVIAADPDVVVMDAFGETVLDTVSRLEESEVPVLLNADFEETTLLGRAEWLKVTATLLNAEAQAEERFAEIQADYEEVAEQVADVDERPQVLHGEPFEGTWFAPGGQSVTAQAIAEAGGEYVFSEDESTESVAYDLETVLDQGADADVWIAAGSVNGTLDDLLANDERFAEIGAFDDGEVWAGDAATNPTGGNARFESAYLRADVYLADLAAIFHPDLVDHDPVYFGQVPEG